MPKRSKSYRAAAEKIHAGEIYAPLAAMRLAKETTVTKFDSTVEVTFRLGVDPRKADQMVRGTVSLPHGTGKTARVLVFAGHRPFHGHHRRRLILDVINPQVVGHALPRLPRLQGDKQNA